MDSVNTKSIPFRTRSRNSIKLHLIVSTANPRSIWIDWFHAKRIKSTSLGLVESESRYHGKQKPHNSNVSQRNAQSNKDSIKYRKVFFSIASARERVPLHKERYFRRIGLSMGTNAGSFQAQTDFIRPSVRWVDQGTLGVVPIYIWHYRVRADEIILQVSCSIDRNNLIFIFSLTQIFFPRMQDKRNDCVESISCKYAPHSKW